MERTLQLLLIAQDPSLPKETETAISELPEEMRLAVHAESDRRRGIEHAIHRAVDAVFVELGDDGVDEALRTVSEIQRGAAELLVILVYRPQIARSENRSDSLFIELMRAGARDFLRRPLASVELEDLLRRHFFSAGGQGRGRGSVISFIGNKGGVGKSTLSLSVACGLARQAPDRVLLIDASLQHGAMCELLGVDPVATISDAARQTDRLDERLLTMLSTPHPCGLRVLAAPPNPVDAAPVDDQAFARILSVARRAFDYVIVDTFPLIDGLTVAILDVTDRVFVVLNDLVPAILGTAELLKVLERIGVSEDRIRVILNHSQVGHRGRLKDLDIAARLDRDIEFVVPFNRRVLAATNTGHPHALRASRRWGFGRAIRAIEEDVRGLRVRGVARAAPEILGAQDDPPKAGFPVSEMPAESPQEAQAW